VSVQQAAEARAEVRQDGTDGNKSRKRTKTKFQNKGAKSKARWAKHSHEMKINQPEPI
jgi:hypothetical protein